MIYERDGYELQLLIANWRKLSVRTKAAILVLADVRPIVGPGPFQKIRRVRRGECPGWLIPALKILKDSRGRITDRQMAVRVGVSASTISRNTAYQNAVQMYEPARKLVRRGPKKKSRDADDVTSCDN